MDRTLADFVRALRSADVRVSTNETLDAFHTVNLIGYEDRATLKDALSITLAKTEEEKHRFSDCFDEYFHFSEFSEDEAQDEGGGDLPPERNDWVPDAPLAQMLLEGDQQGLVMALQRAAGEVNVTEISFFIQRGIYTRRIMERMGLDGLDQEIISLGRDPSAEAQQRVQALEQARSQLFEQVRDFVERQIGLYARSSGRRLREDLLRRIKLTNVDLQDFRLMQSLVQKMARRLAALHGRRKKITKRGQLDVRKTLRHNMPYDGVLVEPRWKSRKLSRPAVFAVCDVSGSVASVARFLLLFLYSLHDVLPRVRAFAFSHRLQEVTSILESMSMEEAINKILHDIGYGTTDYGQALLDLQGLALDDINSRSTVIILGDARSNHLNPRSEILKDIRKRAKWVMFLNPEPRSFWDTGDSVMGRLAPYASQVEVCNTITHLERVVDQILRQAT